MNTYEDSISFYPSLRLPKVIFVAWTYSERIAIPQNKKKISGLLLLTCSQFRMKSNVCPILELKDGGSGLGWAFGWKVFQGCFFNLSTQTLFGYNLWAVGLLFFYNPVISEFACGLYCIARNVFLFGILQTSQTFFFCLYPTLQEKELLDSVYFLGPV